VARKMKNPLVVILTFVLVIAAFLVGRTSAPASAGARSTTTPTVTTFSAFYLDIGASESLGFQPTAYPAITANVRIRATPTISSFAKH